MFKIFSTSITLLISTLFYSQIHNHSHHLDHSNMRDGENVEYCKTHKELNKLMLNPSFVIQRNLDQQKLTQQEQIIKQENLNKAGTIYKVPVVFHVLHNGGVENISRDQILDALSILNRDFRLQNTDANNVVGAFQGMPSDIEIEFVLATIAPDGQCFSGITRTQSPRTIDTDSDNYDGGDQVDAIVNGNDVYQGTWSPSKYLNFYVCKEISGAAGYTYNPGSWATGSMQYNGIFLLHNYTGSIGTSSVYTSRTLTHEVGHWLNLSHTWGPNNNPGNQASCSDDDFVNDTPNTKGVTSCNLSESSCGVLANVENYMDYSYCSKMFTDGQRTRMRAALTSSIAGRSNLWKTSNLNATGTNGTPSICKADFSTEMKIACTGTTVDFFDESYHNPTSWSWSFQGGVPATSSSQNPSVTYSTPGVYSVTLTVANSTGSVTESKSQYITVVSEYGRPAIQEGFEQVGGIPSGDWFVDNSDDGITWELTSVASASGSKCVMLNNDQNNEGNDDELLSTTINLGLHQFASLSFDYAFAKKISSNSDRLLVKVSSNCGQTWVTKKSLSNTTFETAPNTTVNFIPNATQWKTATINSSSLVNFLDSDFRFKFVFESGGGNNVYIDNINIDGFVVITGDLNNDGVIGQGEVSGDTNGDGVIGQGEVSGDTNGDGVISQGEVSGDTNGDGVIGQDEVSGDVDGNGVVDQDEVSGDINGDGVISQDEISGDLDGNGVIDQGETSGDINGDGTIGQDEITGDINGDGIINQNEVEGDIDGDGNVDYVSIYNHINPIGASLYPNPAEDKVTLSFVSTEGDYIIQLLDIVGKEVKNIHNGFVSSGNQKYVLDVLDYSSGVYFISITKGEVKELHKLIVK